MTVRNLDFFFKPRSVVLIGASPKEHSVGSVLASNLLSSGFHGQVHLVNPHYRSINGIPVHNDIGDLPNAAELAIVATPPDTVPGIIAQLARMGTRAAVVITAGFAELPGPEGTLLVQAMLDAARPHLFRIVGPNCIGIMAPRLGLNASFAHTDSLPGRIAFVAQSGAIVTSVLDWAKSRGIGFSHLVSLGNMADVDFGDMLDYRASVINLGGIVYVGLDSLSDYEVAAAVGNSMFADLTSVAGSLYKFGTGRGLPGETTPRRIAIHADEFNELIGDEFIPLLNKAGGAGFQVTAYTQTWSDVEARIGSQAKAGQIAGNFNSLIMLRVKEIATAELLTDQLPEVRIVSTVVSSSVSDTNDPGDFADFASRNEDRITTESTAMLAPSDLVKLPKGQAFALIHGGQLHKLRMPLPYASNDPLMPESLEAIGNEVRSRLDCQWIQPPRDLSWEAGNRI